MSTTGLRKGYLDWLRGIAVLIMIEAHLLDSWTRFSDRHSSEFTYAVILGGFGAPLFLFLAGVAVPLSAGSKFRRSGDAAAAGAAVARRGLAIYGLALLFRVQAWILGWGSPRTLLKVDILNIMGPSIAFAGLLWRSMHTRGARVAVFAIATVATAFVTPVVRALDVIKQLPDPLAAYISPVPGLSNFVFLPWMGFVFAGGLVGLVLDAARTVERERQANVILAIAGSATAMLAYGASFLPSPYAASGFWTTSPAFFLMRVGILTAAIPAAYLWACRPGGETSWSPLRQLGRTSLFIYWIHVEMIYGLISLDLHRSLTWEQVWIAYVLFTLFVLLCSIAKERLMATRPVWQPSDRLQRRGAQG